MTTTKEHVESDTQLSVVSIRLIYRTCVRVDGQQIIKIPTAQRQHRNTSAGFFSGVKHPARAEKAAKNILKQQLITSEKEVYLFICLFVSKIIQKVKK